MAGRLTELPGRVEDGQNNSSFRGCGDERRRDKLATWQGREERRRGAKRWRLLVRFSWMEMEERSGIWLIIILMASSTFNPSIAPFSASSETLNRDEVKGVKKKVDLNPFWHVVGSAALLWFWFDSCSWWWQRVFGRTEGNLLNRIVIQRKWRRRRDLHLTT